MNEAIGAAVYLVLALAVVIGIRAVFSKTGPRKKLDRVAAHTPSLRVAPTENTKKAQSQHPRAQHGHALPWVIPTALAPTETRVENKKAAKTAKTVSERLEIIELRLDRLAGRVAQ
jgi:hypothetical protein